MYMYYASTYSLSPFFYFSIYCLAVSIGLSVSNTEPTVQVPRNHCDPHEDPPHEPVLCAVELDHTGGGGVVYPPRVSILHCKNVRVVFTPSLVISVASYKHPVKDRTFSSTSIYTVKI
jgi:hypothetical protein